MNKKILKFQLETIIKISSKTEYAAGKMYNTIAKMARKGGYEEIAKSFDALSKSETGHGKILDNLPDKFN